MKHFGLFLVLICQLVSCQSGQIESGRVKGETAILRGSNKRAGPLNWESYTIIKVDGEPIIYLASIKEKIKLSPGIHYLDVKAEFNRSDSFLGPGPFMSPCSFQFNAEAGKEYEFSGKVGASNFLIWIEEKATRIKMIEEQTPDFQRSRISYPIYIPVAH